MNLTRLFGYLSASAVLVAVAASGQETNLTSGGYFGDWFARVTKIQSEQPHWITPMTTVTPRLEEEVRYDQSWETSDNGSRTTTFGGKGLELIPCENVEVILGIPAWASHSHPEGEDGFGDESFLVKYRIASGNEDNGNYIATAFLQLTVPTGSKHNTSDNYTVTPTLAGGKGWGDFDIQATAGLSIPDNGTAPKGAGTPLQINTAFQYRLIKVLWPEVEVNYEYWPNGEHEGKEQVFLTPGFLIGRLPIWERVGMTIGLGYQFALTDNPTFNHNFIVSERIPF
ncbi:MAG TPA: hypothetical protein VH595_02940 [Verrucomicrobiae bacterium]|jgi:hypothetical protein|nr:hypothetical protein [Verrucomicrobiae bacterium]